MQDLITGGVAAPAAGYGPKTSSHHSNGASIQSGSAAEVDLLQQLLATVPGQTVITEIEVIFVAGPHL
jgi:hypothetical protein